MALAVPFRSAGQGIADLEQASPAAPARRVEDRRAIAGNRSRWLVMEDGSGSVWEADRPRSG